MKPLMFGYQTARLGTTQADLIRGEKLLHEFARREGYALVEIFVERDINRPCSALVALIDASTSAGASAIVMPDLYDLGRLPRVRALTRQRLERETGARVLVVPSEP